MNNWWVVKRYGDEQIKVKPSVGEQIKQAWIAGNEIIPIPKGPTVSAKAISGVEETTERYEEKNLYLLPDGELTPTGTRPVFAPEYEEKGIKYSPVIWNWYKKNVDRREWESFYSKSPGYYRMDSTDGSMWVALKIVEMESQTKPEYLVLCTKEEQRFLNGKSQT